MTTITHTLTPGFNPNNFVMQVGPSKLDMPFGFAEIRSHRVVMTDGQLEINGVSYQRDDEDPTYDLVIELARFVSLQQK
jgi:hypothetical protein